MSIGKSVGADLLAGYDLLPLEQLRSAAGPPKHGGAEVPDGLHRGEPGAVCGHVDGRHLDRLPAQHGRQPHRQSTDCQLTNIGQ
jgi:hypothetical protein